MGVLNTRDPLHLLYENVQYFRFIFCKVQIYSDIVSGDSKNIKPDEMHILNNRVRFVSHSCIYLHFLICTGNMLLQFRNCLKKLFQFFPGYCYVST